MLCDTDLPVSWRAQPRSFVALMSLYESNHVRFLRLAGDPARLSGTLVSRVSGDCELQLSVLEHMPYTSSLELTYLLSLDGARGAGRPTLRIPNLRLRAYHDARLLEVECPPSPAATGRPGRAERELRQRWARNMMLNKWLEYCAERGHRFAEAASGS
ncbi:MAG TPA: DUF1249 domain-containing protein [Steroidobacteraceae bacterium]|jgi:hypothetical protein|nr:DUF1249 domain-containing protein [Steroidobacteraceae bacterium]